MGATYSAMPAYSRKIKVFQVSVMGFDGLVSTPQIARPLSYTLQDTSFSHCFLILPKCSTLIFGRDLLSKFKASITTLSPPSDLAWLLLLNTTSSTPAPLPSSFINPIVWDTDNPSVSSHHAPIHICLKDLSKFPSQPPYSISQKYEQGLKAIITKLLCQGLSCPTHSPYNTPILPVKKPNGSYHLVQDLILINAAVIPIHPVVPNPYTLLSLIPSSTTHFTVLDLKDVFFTIPLHPDSQDLFAFTWTDQDNHRSQQLIWTVLPQGFHNSPHFLAEL